MAGRYVTSAIARNLRKPENGFFGFLVKKILTSRNSILELQAVKHSSIQPEHNVLEIGFGPGIGIKAAYEVIKDGSGCIFGVDPSEAMLKETQSKVKREISSGKIQVILGSVDNMPYESNTFHRVYHCNCFYFWPDLEIASKEIYRVMKPKSLMVTTLCLESLEKAKEKGFLACGNPDPKRYMEGLEAAGFENVKMEQMKEGDYSYQVIYASTGNKE